MEGGAGGGWGWWRVGLVEAELAQSGQAGGGWGWWKHVKSVFQKLET